MTHDITPNGDISEMARSIAREVDRLPAGKPATIQVEKDSQGKIIWVEISTQERLRLWHFETTVAGI